MNKTILSLACGALFAGTALFAGDPNAAELKQTVAAPEVQQQFDQPDGAAIVLKPDGSFQIFARGTGTYDFDDVDDVNDARREATLKAKAALAKFLNEKLSTAESLESASKKVKSVSSDGKTQNINVTKESVKTTAETIRNSADALLKGVITLKEQRIPKGSGGEIQITVGVSSKTLAVADKLNSALKTDPSQNGGQGGQSGQGNYSRPQTREAVTDF